MDRFGRRNRKIPSPFPKVCFEIIGLAVFAVVNIVEGREGNVLLLDCYSSGHG